jgi:hypothetical protein
MDPAVPPPGLPPQPAAAVTLRQSATKEKPHRTLWLMMGALFAVAAAAGAMKVYDALEEADELRNVMNAAPLKMPEASIPATLSEPVGILADKTRGEDRISVSGTNTDRPDPATALKALELSRQLMPVIGKYGNDPMVQQFKHDFAKDPELMEIVSEFQRDGNVNALIKGMQNSSSFHELIGKYMSDPRFQQMVQQAQSGKSAAPSALRPPPSMVVDQATPPAAAPADSPLPQTDEDEEGPSSDSSGEEQGPLIDPGKVAGEDGSGRTPAPPPPEPKRR